MTEETPLLFERDGPVGIITFNRPKALNAISGQMRTELAELYKEIEGDDSLRVIVLTANGRAFSAGTNLMEDFLKDRENVTDHIMQDYKPLIDAIGASDKTYICALNGLCAGVAIGFALNCDLAVMAEDAFIFMPFANISLVPDGGSSWLFLDRLGYKRAYAAILEGDRLDARTCLDAGMVNKVVPADQVRETAIAWGKKLAGLAPLSLTHTKRLLREAVDMSFDETVKREAEIQHICMSSEDHQEGVAAFSEKRAPVFKGK
ncbi:MAG: enoyl-CoA hydratase/isomerase family protein [Parvibaculales bacterium]